MPSDRGPSPVTWGSLEILPLNEALYPSLDDHRVRKEPTLQLRCHLHQRGREKEEWGGTGRSGRGGEGWEVGEEWGGTGRSGKGWRRVGKVGEG